MITLDTVVLLFIACELAYICYKMNKEN